MKSVEQLPHLSLLRRLFHYLNDTDTALSLRIYKYYIRPHFEYACPVCAALGIQQNSRLEKLHYRVIRIILIMTALLPSCSRLTLLSPQPLYY